MLQIKLNVVYNWALQDRIFIIQSSMSFFISFHFMYRNFSSLNAKHMESNLSDDDSMYKYLHQRLLYISCVYD